MVRLSRPSSFSWLESPGVRVEFRSGPLPLFTVDFGRRLSGKVAKTGLICLGFAACRFGSADIDSENLATDQIGQGWVYNVPGVA